MAEQGDGNTGHERSDGEGGGGGEKGRAKKEGARERDISKDETKKLSASDIPLIPIRPPSVRVRISGKDAVSLLPVKEQEGAVLFNIHAVAGAHHEGVVDVFGGAVRLAVRAPPEKGKANEAIREVLARFAGVKKGAVEILSGHTARRKRVRIEGVGAEVIRKRLLAAIGSVD